MALSTPHAPAEAGEKIVAFALGGQLVGAPIAAVKETLASRPVTPLFLVPSLVAGLINLRGEVVAVLALDELLGLPRPARSGGARPLVILRSGRGDKAACGLLVDRLEGVVALSSSELHPPPPTLGSEPASYLRGVATAFDPPRPILILEPEQVLNTERLRPLRPKRAA